MQDRISSSAVLQSSDNRRFSADNIIAGNRTDVSGNVDACNIVDVAADVDTAANVAKVGTVANTDKAQTSVDVVREKREEKDSVFGVSKSVRMMVTETGEGETTPSEREESGKIKDEESNCYNEEEEEEEKKERKTVDKGERKEVEKVEGKEKPKRTLHETGCLDQFCSFIENEERKEKVNKETRIKQWVWNHAPCPE